MKLQGQPPVCTKVAHTTRPTQHLLQYPALKPETPMKENTPKKFVSEDLLLSEVLLLLFPSKEERKIADANTLTVHER
jgi:hypothetical protein